MDIRNILHKKKESKKQKIILFIVITIILFLIILLFLNIAESKRKPTYNIWDTIQVSGTIIVDNNYPINTHQLFNDQTSFGIKTSTTNLNNFLDQHVVLNWTIEDISTKYPILKISNIKSPTSKLIITDNKYFFTNELISFDFSQDTDIKAEKVDNHIQIYYQDEPVVSIETFICNKVTPTQNCEQLIYTYTNNLNEMFTTFLGYTFYKNKESSRVTFNNQTLWYIIKTTNHDFLLDISHLINIIDSRFVAENKKELINKSCINASGEYLKEVSKISTQIIDQELTRFDIEGTTDKDKKVNCKITIDIRNNWEVKNKSLNYLK